MMMTKMIMEELTFVAYIRKKDKDVDLQFLNI